MTDDKPDPSGTHAPTKTSGPKPWSRQKRRATSATVFKGALALVLLTTLLWIGTGLSGGQSLAASVQPLLIGAVSLAIVAGARWLEGPLRLRTRRRGERAPSNAVAAVLLWLACFAAIETAALLSQLTLHLVATPGQRPGAESPQNAVELDAGLDSGSSTNEVNTVAEDSGASAGAPGNSDD